MFFHSFVRITLSSKIKTNKNNAISLSLASLFQRTPSSCVSILQTKWTSFLTHYPCPILSFWNLCIILNKNLSMPNDPYTVWELSYLAYRVNGGGLQGTRSSDYSNCFFKVSAQSAVRGLFFSTPQPFLDKCLHSACVPTMPHSSIFFIYLHTHHGPAHLTYKVWN